MINNNIDKCLDIDYLPKLKDGKRISWKDALGYKIPFKYFDTYGEIKILSIVKNGYIKVKYNEYIFDIECNSFLKCKFGNSIGMSNIKHYYSINEHIKDYKRDLIILSCEYGHFNKRKGSLKYYKYKCNRCGWSNGYITEYNLKNGSGCLCCNNKIIVEGINDIPTTAPWMVKYFQGGYDEAKLYARTSRKKIFPICPDCGKIKNKSISINSIYYEMSIRCICSDGISYPEKLMYSILSNLNISFEYQKRFKWCKYKLKGNIFSGTYDFYFEKDKKKFVIETDGGWHVFDNTISGQTAKESKFIDKQKEILANNYNIEIIRIDCQKSELEYIKNNIFNSKLNNLFDLSDIDWIKCGEFATSNIVKKVCNYKKDNPELTTTDIGVKFKLNRATIYNYFRKGNELGWCEYNPEKEKLKNRKSNNIKVEIFKDNQSLGIFKSLKDLERQSKQLFGVTLYYKYVSKILFNKKWQNGKYRKFYHGFSFKLKN